MTRSPSSFSVRGLVICVRWSVGFLPASSVCSRVAGVLSLVLVCAVAAAALLPCASCPRQIFSPPLLLIADLAFAGADARAACWLLVIICAADGAADGAAAALAAAALSSGHYDVVPAGSEAQWTTDPWTMSIKNGFIYGRGVSDDKGPLVASIFAAAKLKREGKLCMDVVFLVEGAEESGIGRVARGLDHVVSENLRWFRKPSVRVRSEVQWSRVREEVTEVSGVHGAVVPEGACMCGQSGRIHGESHT
jgi:hypothetical protein